MQYLTKFTRTTVAFHRSIQVTSFNYVEKLEMEGNSVLCWVEVMPEHNQQFLLEHFLMLLTMY